MKIIVDTREQHPLDFSPWPDTEMMVAGLPAGDYSLPGLETRAAIERKSLDDLASTLSAGRERFEAELAKARGYDLFVIVCEGGMEDVARHRYRSRMLPESILQSLFSFQARYDVPTLWAGSPRGAAYAVRSLLGKYLRERQIELRALLQAAGESLPRAAAKRSEKAV